MMGEWILNKLIEIGLEDSKDFLNINRIKFYEEYCKKILIRRF